ncbi:hypothetical protein [Bacillus dakarensis]|uniref:hypothetical protein n=1 Tax=Robertmurraya dakarensis TaxID=1926278 RepID=UPI0011159CB6|nr:hypothetical protein [Bacillus dakarensis]
MKHRRRTALFIGLILFLVSAIPLFIMGRELFTGWQIDRQYSINHVYSEQGFPSIIDTQEIEVNGVHIEIIEEPTGKKASLTPWDEDEGVEAGDIVKIYLLIDGREVTSPDEIWLSNRNRGSRYYSWLDILTVNEQIAIVQRLTDDDAKMDERQWKIIWIDEKGDAFEEVISYQTRSENPLAVRLIGFSGTALMAMGYYSDLLMGYPSVFFPILYPILTGVVGILLCIMFFIQYKRYAKLGT